MISHHCTFYNPVNEVNTMPLNTDKYQRTAVRCIELGIVYKNLTQAAEAIGCGKSAMSNHLAGRFPHVRGLHFERVQDSPRL